MSKESRRAARNAARPGGTGTTSTGPSGADRAGRRERVRHYEHEVRSSSGIAASSSAAVVVAVAAVVIGLVVVQSTAASYSARSSWIPRRPRRPPPERHPAWLRTGRHGQQPRRHQAPEVHVLPAGVGQPLQRVGPRADRPARLPADDNVGPPNWVHNLEHGGLVILYRGDSPGATEAGQQAFRSFFDTFPPSPICELPAGQISPVIARFDDMKWPYAALVWDRVLPLPEWDPALALQFYATESERLDADGAFVAPPEPQCSLRPRARHRASRRRRARARPDRRPARHPPRRPRPARPAPSAQRRRRPSPSPS